MKKKRIIIGITGASGLIYGVRLLELLRYTDYETHLIVSKAAQQTRAYESTLTAADLYNLADRYYSISDIAACISSGSYLTGGMIIAPCSMRTLADIAYSTTSNLLTRAADVILKERRRLVLMVRETPLHLGHIENMKRVTEIGATIAPPIPAFYNNPKTIDDLVNHSVGRVLDLFDIDINIVQRWESRNISVNLI
ncbi:UbiX family flavin prenyltransferase [Legionella clemsonensis]|uniref:Flavin prenyltransferase UbiX n=1 Tax=Legionella clemsonensis TaxID=1867846 RepID=A0A222P002_9GAMM|nr:UbiX family flavin prenyltransferase [Legionella clemsonensis]ASQ45158.1 3-octaprenyl-4-hydroxybenzoate carboxy-lyase partner protein [Legionella clemsonensis]